MSSKLKIFLFIGLLFLLFIIIALSLYFLLGIGKEQEAATKEEYYEIKKVTFKSEEEPTDIENNNSQEDTNGVEESIDGKILDINIDNAELVSDSIYFYSKEEKAYGRINISEEDNKTEILLNNLPVLSEAFMSPAEDKLLYKDFNKNTYFVYDFNSQKTTELNKNISTAFWHSTEKDKIIGIYSGSNINNINIYNIDNNEREELINLFVNIGTLLDITKDGKRLMYVRDESWLPEEAEVTFEEIDPDPSTESFFMLFDIENKKNILQKEDIDRGKFNPNGKDILISRQSAGPYPRLAIYDIDNSNETSLNLSSYLEKIEFINESALIYAKREANKGGFSKDTLWRYNINSGKSTKLTRLEEEVVNDISNIMVSEDEQKIYFINRYDKKLYVVNTNK